MPNPMAGNVRLEDARTELRESEGVWILRGLGEIPESRGPQVTSKILGRAAVPDLPFVRPDGSPYALERDYFGRKSRSQPGPFADPGPWQVWPIPGAAGPRQ
jgi:hypothetical protein